MLQGHASHKAQGTCGSRPPQLLEAGHVLTMRVTTDCFVCLPVIKTVASQNAERTDRDLVADIAGALCCLVQGGGTARLLSLKTSAAFSVVTSTSAPQQPRGWRAVQERFPTTLPGDRHPTQPWTPKKRRCDEPFEQALKQIEYRHHLLLWRAQNFAHLWES